MTHLALLAVLIAKLHAAPCIIILHGNTIVSTACPSPLLAQTITLPKANTNQPYTADVTGSVSGGVKPYIFIATSDLDGLSLSPDGKLTGIPKNAGVFNLTWTVVDSAGTVIYVQ
jgi:hypothetical protein